MAGSFPEAPLFCLLKTALGPVQVLAGRPAAHAISLWHGSVMQINMNIINHKIITMILFKGGESK